MASREIDTMRKMTKIGSKNLNYDATPRIFDYGLCNLANFDQSSQKLVAFYIMPLYEMDLLNYLSRF